MSTGCDKGSYTTLTILAACATAGVAASGCASSSGGAEASARAPVEYRNAAPAQSAAAGPAKPFYQKRARQSAPHSMESAMAGDASAFGADASGAGVFGARASGLATTIPAAPQAFQSFSTPPFDAPALDPEKLGEPVEVLTGDTLYRVSERYRIALRALIETNQLEPPFALEPGQTIYLPPPNVHVVEKGETLYSISRRYNVDTRSLSLMNGLPKPWTIHPGDKITLPSLARDSERNAGQDIIVEAPAPAFGANRQVLPAPNSTPNSTPRFDEPSPLHSKSFSAPAGATPLSAFGAISGGSDTFIWPLRGEVLRPYGLGSGGRKNDGVNISALPGTPILAAAAGEVVYAGDELAGFGNLVLISHAKGWVTAYAHADELIVQEGQRVRQGQPIGAVGDTGSVDRPQLHFELRKGKNAVDPSGHMPPIGAT